jgi:hypothetical protein
MYKLGFSLQEYCKSIYFDGQKQDDVVESRKAYIKEHTEIQKQSQLYGSNSLEMAASVDPEILGDRKETVFIFHNEYTVHTKERPSVAWLLPGSSELQTKDLGQLIHISDFILKSTSQLTCTSSSANNLGSKNAATIIYPGSTGNKWWGIQQLCLQVTKKAIPIFKKTHLGCQAVFVFDRLSAHGAPF